MKELRWRNSNSEMRPTSSRPNQVVGYKSAIIGYTEPAAEPVAKPSYP